MNEKNGKNGSFKSANLDAVIIQQDLFASREAYCAMRSAWRSAVQSARSENPTKTIPASLYVLYSLIKRRDASGILKVCTPITNPVKLQNGMRPYQSLQASLQDLILRREPATGKSAAEIWGQKGVRFEAVFGSTFTLQDLYRLQPVIKLLASKIEKMERGVLDALQTAKNAKDEVVIPGSNGMDAAAAVRSMS